MNMKYIKKICSVLLLLPLLSQSVSAQTTWRRISYLDFGGNSATADQFRSYELEGGEGESSSEFAPAVSLTTKYCIGKYVADGKCGWVSGGDHTNLDDKKRGYFLMLNCPQGCGGLVPCSGNSLTDLEYPKQFIYQKSLAKNICANVTFKFEAYVANMAAKDPSSSGSYITLGVYDANDEIIWQRDPLLVPVSSASSEALNWQKIEGIFSVPSSADLSKINFRIYPTQGGKPGAERNGYDFGLDDIAIYVEQPSVDFTTTELLYQQPATITATLGSNVFFANLNEVAYYWEYSVDGETFTKIGSTYNYKDSKSFKYDIASFDKDDKTGNGNGYYRITMATSSDINNINDESVCCVRDTFQINETKNKLSILICEEGSAVVDGVTFTKADEGVEKTTPKNFVVTTHVIKKEEVVEPEKVCIGQEFPVGSGIIRDTKGDFVDTLDVVKSKRLNYDKQYCDSVVNTFKLSVTDGDVDSLAPEHICVGKRSGFSSKLYDEVGEFTESNKVGCLTKVATIIVHTTYDVKPDVYICQDQEYEGKVYSTPGDYILNPNKLKSIFGCDSSVTANLHVREQAVGFLPDEEICQSDFGAGQVAFSYDGKDYINTTSKDLVLDLEKFEPTDSGCDSVTKQHVVIHPIIHTEGDTLICRDQILFGKEWTIAGKYDYDMNYKTANGCDSTVTWHITVLDIQLKLRAEFGASSVCEGQAITLIVDLIPSTVPLRWEPELTSRNPLRPVVNPEKTTMYVAHAENNVGCHATDSINIAVYPNPSLVIDTIDQQARELFFAVSGGTPEYTYMIGNKNVEPEDGKLSGLTYGTHEFRVIDSAGCVAVDSFALEPLAIKPGVIVTPNGDGVNDTWNIDGIDAYPDSYVRIYDRFGKLIYEVRGYQNETGWNGEYNGNKVPTSDYWYVIDLESIDKQFVGHFTLLR